MLRLRVLPIFLGLLLAFPSILFAQEQAAETSENEAAIKQGLELLDAIAESIPSLRSADNRIYLSLSVADLLWTSDEKRARLLFETLTKEVSAQMANLNPNDQRSINTLGFVQQQRREIIDRMAHRDPEMALVFLRSTRPPAGIRRRGNQYGNEGNIELHLASMIAQKDPDQAVKIARASLRNGISYAAVSVLHNLFSKNPDTARSLHTEIIDKLKGLDLVTDYEASNAAWNLIGSFQPPQATEETYRTLVELMATTILAVKPDARAGNSFVQNSAGQFSSYRAQFEKYAPAQTAALKQWTKQLARTQDLGSTLYQEMSEITQKGTVEDLLALTGKYSKEHHAQIYQQAAQKAIMNGDAARARQIITEFIADVDQRRQILEQLDNQLFWNSVNGNKFADALQVLERVKAPEQRFQLLIAMAQNVMNRGEKKQAASLLAEARTLLDDLPRNAQKMAAQMQLAQSYAPVDSQQSVVLIHSVIVLINQLVEAAAVLDGFENQYLNQGEWMKRNHTGLGNVVNSIGQNLGALARVNVDEARSLSNQLERPEIRLMAQLEIAQSLLTNGNGRHSNFRRLSVIGRH
ncbi:MAG TPA: hypothetical protein VJU86_18410 [Pyrinomonadaceae bacterium]|nr:hypothetical protein [Pyrinomonadaceae bacterium]